MVTDSNDYQNNRTTGQITEQPTARHGVVTGRALLLAAGLDRAGPN